MIDAANVVPAHNPAMQGAHRTALEARTPEELARHYEELIGLLGKPVDH